MGNGDGYRMKTTANRPFAGRSPAYGSVTRTVPSRPIS